MVLKPIREIKKKPVCQLGKGTRLLVPRHQNSGAWTPELWCPYLIFVAVLSMHIYSCWQCLKKKKTVSANTLLCKTLLFCSNLHNMSVHWWENPPKKMGAPEFWCPGTRLLVPGTRSLVPFQADKQVFCFNFKNGLQNYEFLWFAKCLYVFYAKPGYIRTLPA